jgi:hypothetical protein
MVYLEHSDFSLIPDPNTPTKWRGVAKNAQGIRALLALEARPLDDPQYPMALFEWFAHPPAVHALQQHAKDAHVRPFLEACRDTVCADALKNALYWPTRFSEDDMAGLPLVLPCVLGREEDGLLYATVHRGPHPFLGFEPQYVFVLTQGGLKGEASVLRADNPLQSFWSLNPDAPSSFSFYKESGLRVTLTLEAPVRMN